MIKYYIICIGKLKEDYFKTASLEYEKRISRFCKLNIIEIPPIKLSENASDNEIQNALDKESEFILERIPKNTYTISLCIDGKNFDSVIFSKQLAICNSDICFIIGGSYGLSEKVKQKSNLKLSLSKMTFPHRLARIVLLEQIYRSFMIDRKYHK